MQNISELNIERVRVITVAKVASSAFSHSLSQKFKTSHGHSLQLLKDVLANEENTLVISGIRNPLARNLSYFFQTYNDKKHNDVKCKSNKYKGEKCFVMSEKDLLSLNAEKIIDVFFKQKWHETFNHWFKEFLELTQIDKQGFDKETGFQLYPLDNNNWLLIYTFEKLKDNTPYFEEFFGIQDLSHTNNPNDRAYKDLYKEVKSKITFDSEYSKMLLDTDIVRLFYCREDIERFINGAL